MADPVDPDQALRKRLTAQLAPQAQAADAPSASETPLSAPVDPAPFAPAPANPSMGGGLSQVTPTYGTTAPPTYGTTAGPTEAPWPEVPLSEQPLPVLGPPVLGPPETFPAGPDVPLSEQPLPPEPPPPPPMPPLSDPGWQPTSPLGSPDTPQMTYPPNQPLPAPPLSAPPHWTPSPALSMGAAPQQQLRHRLLSTLRRPQPRRRF